MAAKCEICGKKISNPKYARFRDNSVLIAMCRTCAKQVSINIKRIGENGAFRRMRALA